MHTGFRWLVAVAGAAVLGLPASGSAQERWRLEEIARIGGTDEGLASFNQIVDLQIDADGRIWVLDAQTQTLRLFAADGKPIKEVARRGKGPGELAKANGIRRGPDGRMYVRDFSNARIAIFGPDGTSLAQPTVLASSYGYRWEGGIDPQRRVVELTSIRRGAEYTRVVLRRSPDMSATDTAEFPVRCLDAPLKKNGVQGKMGFVGIPFMPRLLSTVGTSGAVWCASSDEYKLRRFAFGADAPDLEITRSVPRVPISRAERDSSIKNVEEFLTKIGGAVDPWSPSAVPRDRGPLVGFETDDQDRLWVVREMPDGALEFDVWDTRGKQIAVLPSPLRYGYVPLFRVLGDRIAMLTFDEDELPFVVVSRIVRR